MASIEQTETTIDLVAIVAIIGVAIYAIYKFPAIWQSIKDDFSAIGNAVYTPSYPGGGQTAGTSETYSGALDTATSDPTGTLGTLVGSPPVYSTIPDPTTAPGLPAGYNPSTGAIDETLIYNGGTGK